MDDTSPILLGLLKNNLEVSKRHTQNLHWNSYYPKPKYLIIGYLDPLGLLHQISGDSLVALPGPAVWSHAGHQLHRQHYWV